MSGDTGARRTVEEMLTQARARLVRLTPTQAAAAQAAGALFVDIRGDDQIRTHGTIPGSIRIPRNVLEWRLDPACPARDALLADPRVTIVIVCQEGYQSSLAASTLHDLGLVHATDLEGGFEAWQAEGLPVERSQGASTRITANLRASSQRELRADDPY